MADNSVAARREARRRRILENSEARLKKITGRDRATVKEYGSQNGPIYATTLEDTRNGPSNSQVCFHTFDGEQFEHLSDAADADSSESLSRFLTEISEPVGSHNKNLSTQSTFVKTIQESRLHFVGVAVIVRLMFYIDCGFIFGESIFVPLFIFEVTDAVVMKVASVRTTSSAGGVVTTILVLSGITPNKASGIAKFLALVSKIGKDFAVYFISFVAIHCLMGWPG